MKLAISTTCSNEGRYLLEWVIWHKCLGFDYFYIHLDNNEEDQDFVDARRILEASGCVEFHKAVKTMVTKDIQMDTYNTSLELAAARGIDWMMAMDLDEYLVPFKSIRDILGPLPRKVAQVSFSWLCFGSNGEKEFDPTRTHFEKFTKSATSIHRHCIFPKSIVRVGRVNLMNIHIHDVRGKSLDGNLDPLRRGVVQCATRKGHYDIGFIAHFSLRSRGEFEAKQKRGYASSFHTQKIDEAYWNIRDCNHCEMFDLPRTGPIIRGYIERWKRGDFDLPADAAIQAICSSRPSHIGPRSYQELPI